MEPPILRVSELYQRRQAKDAARLRAYNQILETVHHRIRVQGNMPNSPCSLLYTIPPFVLGLPKIDLEDCVVYLVYQLRQSGFDVRYSYPNLLAISWVHHERSYITDQSPIMLAMLATQAPPPTKKRASVAGPGVGRASVAGPGVGRASGSGAGAASGKAPKAIHGIAGPSQRPQKSVGFSLSSGGLAPPSVGLAPPSVGHLPAAEDYIPPSTFLQTMNKPDPKSPAMASGVLADLWR